ncbi:MAG: LysR family transcriptional regulator [Burkholderiales bacterium]
MDKFQQMRVFAAVVDAGSFVGAAAAIELSKAAVSRHVQELEARLGVLLLQRTTRRLSLTDEGRAFHARCKDLLANVDEAEAEITVRAGEASGLLKINVPVSFGNLRLAPLWGAFLERNPKVTLDIVLADRVVDLVEEGFDMAVRIARLPDSSLVSRQLASTQLIVCASPAYLARHGTPQHPADLAHHAVVAYSLFSMGDNWQFEGPDGPASVKVRPRVYANSGDTCRAVALQHQGIVLQPSFLVGDDLKSGALVPLLPAYRSIKLGIYAVYPTRRHLSPKVRALVDFLVESARRLGWPT